MTDLHASALREMVAHAATLRGIAVTLSSPVEVEAIATAIMIMHGKAKAMSPECSMSADLIDFEWLAVDSHLSTL